MFTRTIEDNILSLLSLEGPKPRAYIEAILVYQHSAAPNGVTSALRRLRCNDTIRRQPIAHGRRNISTDIYSLHKLCSSEVQALREAFHVQEEVFNPSEMRLAAEAYVRSLAIRASVHSCAAAPTARADSMRGGSCDR